MNILFIRITNRISGAEKYNYYLAQELKQYSDINPIFLTDCEKFRNYLKKFGFLAHSLPISIKEIGTKKDLLSFVSHILQFYFTYIRIINKLQRIYKFKIICFESMTEKIFLTLLLRLFSYKIVWIEHGPLFITECSMLIKKMYLFISKFSNKIITVSDNTANDLISGGVAKRKISTVYIGIDTNNFQKDTHNINKIIPNKTKVVGFIGTLNEQKGVMRFIHIAELLLRKDFNIFFIIVGDGPQSHKVSRYLKEQKLENHFLLTGFVDEVLYYVQQMNIVIFPTKHNEGLSLAILEALAIGKLVFAYNIGGNSELIIQDKTGYLFQEINDKLIDLILVKLKDRVNQKRIKYNAIDHVSRYFNLHKQALFFEKIFADL